MISDRESLTAALPAYELGGELGRGAWGVVLAAQHRRLQRSVAVKLLPSALVADERARRRFEDEARILAALDHPHVVRIYDYVESDEVCALVMQRLDGGTLTLRTRGGRPGPAVSCAVALATLAGLEHAHEAGVLHRDIKPDNLLFGADGCLRVTDFGIARLIDDAATRRTLPGVALGTPAYMAPEQAAAKGPALPATDVYATAAVLFELLSGALPQPPGDDLASTVRARAEDDPIPLGAVAPGLPEPIVAAVMGALARDPADRPPTAAAFADELSAAAGDAWGEAWLRTTEVPVHRAPRRIQAGRTVEAPPEPGPLGRPAPPGRPWRRGAAIAVAAVAIGVALVASSGGRPGASSHDRVPAGLPPLPAGWPASMPLGVADQTEGSAVVRARFGAGGLVEKDFGGDVLARQDWSSQGDGRAAAAFAADANGRGLTAVAVYYELRVIGRRGRPDRQADAIRAALGNATLMRAYWRNAEELVRQFGSAGGRATLVVEPSVLSILQAAGVRDPRRVRVVVSSAGVRELRGLSPSLVGFAQAWTRLRDRLAPRLRLALPFDDYATGDSIAPTNPPPPAVDARAVDAGAFYRRLGARYDLAAYETAVGDAGHGHGAATWEPSDYVSVTRYLRGLVRAARLRVLLIGVPVGNTVTRSMDNTPYHWRDNHVQWMLGAGNRLAHLRSLRDAGVIGAVFGFGNAPADETCACDAARDGITNPPPVDGSEHVTTSADDDGGYLGERVVALRRAGGIALR